LSRFQILALSGGGYKGLFSAKILASIEQNIDAPIATRFDLISGTSIGGIISIAIALEIPANKIVNVFSEHGSTIFPLSRPKKTGIIKSKHSSNGLKDVLFELFEDKKIKDLKHPLIIPSINFTKGSPQIFKTRHHKDFFYDQELNLVDVALSTSAAPTYFPIHNMDNGDFIDGGLVANHPGLYAVIEAQKFLKISIDDIYQLHIGTMSNKCKSNGNKNILKSGLLQWKSKLIDLIFSCQEQSTDQILNFMLDDRYLSIDYELSDEQARVVGIDKVDSNAKKLLLNCAEIAKQENFGNEIFIGFLKHNKEKFEPIPMRSE